MEEKLEIIAQLSGFKSLATGGWKLSMDLFETREKDIAAVALLVNEQMTVKVILEKYDEKG